MTNIELLTRGFETPAIRPLTREQREEQLKNEGFVVWGRGGGSTFQRQNAANDFDTVDEQQDEVTRTYDTVKVKNPDDEDQYIETEVMTGFQARSRIDGSRVTLRFAPPQETKNTEITQRDQKRENPSVSRNDVTNKNRNDTP